MKLSKLIKVLGYEILRKANEEGRPFKYYCALLEIPELYAKLNYWQKHHINEKDIHEQGLEPDPHITILWGLHNFEIDGIKEIIRDWGKKTIELKLGKMSIFDTAEDYDVLKCDVESEDLVYLHNQIKEKLPNTQTHDGYHPHFTIGYFYKGTVDKFVGCKDFAGIKVIANSISLSEKNGDKTEIFL